MNAPRKWTIAASLVALGFAGTLALADDGWPGRGRGADDAPGRRDDRPRAQRLDQRRGSDDAFAPGEGRPRGPRGGEFAGPQGRGFGPGFGAGLGFAAGPGFGPGAGPGPRGPMEFLGHPAVREKIGLTDEQWQAIQTDRDARREAGKATREQLGALHEELHAMLTGEADPDLGSVNELAGRIDILRSEQHAQMLAHAVFVRQTLTAEQEAALRELRDGRGGRAAAFAGRGGERGPRDPQAAGDDAPGRPRWEGRGGPDDAPRGPRGGDDRPRGDFRRGQGPRGADAPRGVAPRGEAFATRLQEQLAQASPEEAAAIRERVRSRVEAALARIEQQQAAIDEIMGALEATSAE